MSLHSSIMPVIPRVGRRMRRIFTFLRKYDIIFLNWYLYKYNLYNTRFELNGELNSGALQAIIKYNILYALNINRLERNQFREDRL